MLRPRFLLIFAASTLFTISPTQTEIQPRERHAAG